MVRLIKTEKEVEGRYEEQYVVVQEDVLEQWPSGPREVVGRPAPRVDGHIRARGEATFTSDLQLPGMLHTAVLRSPHAHARVRLLDLGAARRATGVRAAIGPEDLDSLTDEPKYRGASVAAVAADTEAEARAALGLIDVEWEVLEPLVDPEEAIERGSLHGDPRNYER